MNTSQRNAAIKVLRYYKQRNDYNDVTSVRMKVEPTDYGVVWLTVETRRSDCGRYSARAIVCQQRAHICLGKRGRVVVWDADSGMTDEAKHVATMLGGSVHK